VSEPRGIPPEYMPIVDGTGLFSLCGGPLCGYTTDHSPAKSCIAPLHWQAQDGQDYLCEYRFDPEEDRYVFSGMERVSWG
jgi:hypothetical protein